MTTYDYVIVGGGSAGCVLANRLSERPDRRGPAHSGGETSGNTNAPVIMIAEKAADLIMEDR